MARINSVLAATSIAALTTVSLASSVMADPGVNNSVKVTPTFVAVSSPGVATFTVDVSSVADPGEPVSKFTAGLFLEGADAATLSGWLANPLPVLNTATSNPVVQYTISFNIPSGLTTGTNYFGNFRFTSAQTPAPGVSVPGGANQTFAIQIADIPEPSTVAFGVIAAGSVLGLIARRRKA